MKTFIIYKAERNGKSYIGYTNTDKGFNRRKYEHVLNADNGKISKFYNALRKYGNEFQWSSIIDGIDNKELAIKLEIEYIDEYDSYINGYNSTIGGDGGRTWDNSGKNNPCYIHLDEELVNSIIEEYDRGTGLSDISKNYNLTIGKVRRTLLENDIPLRLGKNITSPWCKSVIDKPVHIRQRPDMYDKSGKNNPRYRKISDEIMLEIKTIYESGGLNKKELMEKYTIGHSVLSRIFKECNIMKYKKYE